MALQGYMHKIGQILLFEDTTAEPSQPLVDTLLEVGALFCCIMAYNVDTLKRAFSNRMDNGQPIEDHLGVAFYTQYLVGMHPSHCLCSLHIFCMHSKMLIAKSPCLQYWQGITQCGRHSAIKWILAWAPMQAQNHTIQWTWLLHVSKDAAPPTCCQPVNIIRPHSRRCPD